MSYWLMKSEPSTFGIDDLAQSPRRTTHWDGVRNFQARNFMRDEMRLGDLAFFYHSSCAEPGIVGIVKVVKQGYPDSTAFDARDALAPLIIELADDDRGRKTSVSNMSGTYDKADDPAQPTDNSISAQLLNELRHRFNPILQRQN